MGRTLHNWAFRYEGSTRTTALLRIALALLIWYRFLWGVNPTLRHSSLGWAIALSIAVFLMLIGLWSRAATFATGVITLAAYFYFFLTRHDMTWFHHHTYFMGIAAFMLALGPCGKSYSFDRLLAVRRASRTGQPAPLEEGNLFALRLLSIQLAILYFFAFWDKTFIAGTNDIFYNFLNGTRLEQILMYEYRGSDFALQPWMDVVASAMAITVALLELVLPLILFRRFQKYLIIPGLGLHLAFYVLLPLQTYSLTCIVLYLALFDANWVHGLIDLLGPGGQSSGSTGGTSVEAPRYGAVGYGGPRFGGTRQSV